MTIIFNNCNYKYEVESLFLLFYPLSKFNVLLETNVHTDADYISVTKTNISLICITSINKTILEDNIVLDSEQNNIINLSKILFNNLKKITNITPMWGTLTGIRPVFRVNNLYNMGYSYSDIENIFTNDYLVDKKKTSLAITIAKEQEKVLKLANKNAFSLYVSIPFCESRCSYCSFVSSATNNKKAKALIAPYVEKLCEELIETAKLVKKNNLTLMSVYIGGGTPTAISAEELGIVMDTIKHNFDLNNILEYTVEAGRADTITYEKLVRIKQYATRISINPQTFNDDILKSIGRHHTAQDTIDRYNQAIDLGYDNVNMDFIAGLPNEDLDSFKNSIDTAITLNPANITVHTLSIKRSSTLKKDTTQITYNETEQMIEYAIDTLLNNGYIPYYLYKQKNTINNLENIGFYKGEENIGYYNIFIMEEMQSILAVGAGAVSKLVDLDTKNLTRSFNYKHIYEYIDDFPEMIKRKQLLLDL